MGLFDLQRFADGVGEEVWVRSSEEPVPGYIELPMQMCQTAEVAAGSAEVEVAEEVRKSRSSQHCKEMQETAVGVSGPPILAFEEVPAMEAEMALLSAVKIRTVDCMDSSWC